MNMNEGGDKAVKIDRKMVDRKMSSEQGSREIQILSHRDYS